MANVGVSAVRLIDNDNDVVSVTNNKLDVNATLVAGATIDIGDVDMFLDGGTAIVGGNGAATSGTLRVTIASDTTGVLSVDDNGSTLSIDDGGGTITVDGSVTLINSSIKIQGTAAENAAINGNPVPVGGRYDSSARTLDDGDVGAVALNASGHLLMDVVDGGQLDTIIDTLETTLTAIETDQAAIEVLLTGIDSDTDAIKTAVQILDDWDDSNYANVNLNLAGSDAPTGGGAESGALRVTIANDSTGVVSIDDGGNVITVDGTVDLGSTATTHLSEIEGAVETIEGAVDSGQMQVDVVASLPAGTNNIGDVDVASTVQSSPFDTFVSYPDFEAATSATAISDGTNGVNATITDAKEIIIQTDDANTEYIMVGSGSGTALAGNVGSRKGIKMNGGETLILAYSTFADIFIDASTSGQYINVAYFK